MRSSSAQAVFDRPELVEKIVEHLTRWEAVALLETNKALSSAAAYCLGRGQCRPRLVLTSSRNNKLVEINPITGEVTQAKPAAPPGYDLAKQDYQWITGVAFGPTDHRLYVCNYQVDGIEWYHGGSLVYGGIFVSSETLNSPEGLAFSKDFCYVGGATHGVVAIVALNGQILKVINMASKLKHFPVPWGLTVLSLEGIDLLMVSIDSEYEAVFYKDAPDRKTGALYSCAVYKASAGALLKGQKFQNLTSGLQLGVSRPSGIFVEPIEVSENEAQARLFITSMHSTVLQYEVSIGKDQKGKVRELQLRGVKVKFDVPAQPRKEQWDVRPIGDSVFVTSHIAYGSRHACLQLYNRLGILQKVVKSEDFSEPNMLAVDY